MRALVKISVIWSSLRTKKTSIFIVVALSLIKCICSSDAWFGHDKLDYMLSTTTH